jgi:hypothetical protein
MAKSIPLVSREGGQCSIASHTVATPRGATNAGHWLPMSWLSADWALSIHGMGLEYRPYSSGKRNSGGRSGAAHLIGRFGLSIGL